jgi:hypothetical protein
MFNAQWGQNAEFRDVKTYMNAAIAILHVTDGPRFYLKQNCPEKELYPHLHVEKPTSIYRPKFCSFRLKTETARSLRKLLLQVRSRLKANIQTCNIYAIIPPSHTYRQH